MKIILFYYLCCLVFCHDWKTRSKCVPSLKTSLFFNHIDSVLHGIPYSLAIRVFTLLSTSSRACNFVSIDTHVYFWWPLQYLITDRKWSLCNRVSVISSIVIDYMISSNSNRHFQMQFNRYRLHCKCNHNQQLLSWLHKVFDYLPCYIMSEIWFGIYGKR